MGRYCVSFALTNVFLLVSDLMLTSYLHLATSVGLEEEQYYRNKTVSVTVVCIGAQRYEWPSSYSYRLVDYIGLRSCLI